MGQDKSIWRMSVERKEVGPGTEPQAALLFRGQEEEERRTKETEDGQLGKREANQESMVFWKPERESFSQRRE